MPERVLGLPSPNRYKETVILPLSFVPPIFPYTSGSTNTTPTTPMFPSDPSKDGVSPVITSATVRFSHLCPHLSALRLAPTVHHWLTEFFRILNIRLSPMSTSTGITSSVRQTRSLCSALSTSKPLRGSLHGRYLRTPAPPGVPFPKKRGDSGLNKRMRHVWSIRDFTLTISTVRSGESQRSLPIML